ncbi:MAG: hypothetical protein J5772_04695 [Clostridia bacterium]|nr:hypothetical protein [Clostridia bacterium]
MKTRIIAAAVAALLTVICLFAAVPALAEESGEGWSPYGYDRDEYLKLRALLETEDEKGVKNGTKINENYDPNDPSTWHIITSDGMYGAWFERYGGIAHITYLFLRPDMDLCGEIELSDCRYLIQIFCINAHLTSVKAENCPELLSVDVRSDNEDGTVRSIDFSDCPQLETLITYGNPIESADLDGCTGLVNVDHEILVLAGLVPEEGPGVPSTGGVGVTLIGAALIAFGVCPLAAAKRRHD